MKLKPNIIHLLLLFLTLPNIIFLTFWFKWYISVPSLLLFVYLLVKADIIFLSSKKNNSNILKSITLLVSIYLAVLSGTCNFLSQTFDFIKHHLILCDLVNFKWPVIYDNAYYLSYNVAYYLIPAGIAKLISKDAAEYLLFIQLSITIFLGLRYIQQYVTKNPYHSFLIVIFPNSFFLLRKLFVIIGFDLFNVKSFSFACNNLFEQPLYLEISTLITQVQFVPQHLSALLISGCLIHYSWKTKNTKLSLLICCLTPLWSVFTAFPIFILTLFQLIIYYKKTVLSLAYLIFSFLLLFVFTSYYTGHSTIGMKFIWLMSSLEILEIILFLIFAALPYIWFVLFFKKNSTTSSGNLLYRLIVNKKNAHILTVSCCVIIPFFFFNYQLDLMLRGTATLLFLINLWLLSLVHKLKPLYFYLFILIFSIGGFFQFISKPKYEIKNSIDRFVYKNYPYYLRQNKTIYDLDSYHSKGIKYQYISNSNNSIYYKYFIRKPFSYNSNQSDLH